MPAIRIERVPISVANLGLFGFDHLQLVFQPDGPNGTLPQDSWYVFEGVREAGVGGPFLGVDGTNGTTTLVEANRGLTGALLQDAIGTPQQRGSRVLPFPDTAAAWNVMAAAAREIDAQAFPYIAFSLGFGVTPTVNSHSVIASLLYYAGADLSASWPSGMGLAPGATTLLGTRANDVLFAERGFHTLLGGAGRDSLNGSAETDRLFGGVDDDTFMWSQGYNYVHGGQPRLSYAQDGDDTINYTGAGVVVISGNAQYIENRTPTYMADYVGGHDDLFSIEKLVWNETSDHVIFQRGAVPLPDGMTVKMGGQSNSLGDIADFSATTDAMVFQAAADGDLVGRIAGKLDADAGIWINSAETLIATSADDRIYATPTLHDVEAGAGKDLIDARKVQAGSSASPRGYDVEADGGAGDDILVANAGRSLLHGGGGSDVFVLSSLSSGLGKVEIVIDDADATDQLVVPYNFFNGSGAGLDGSDLMLLRGGLGSFDDMVAYGFPSVFEFRRESEYQHGSDDTLGNIRFIGSIEYTVEASDLLVHVYGGHTAVALDPSGTPHTYFVRDDGTEAIIRIKDYSQGDLGLTFYDPGTMIVPPQPGVDYPAWNVVVDALTAPGLFKPSLDQLPKSPTQRPDAPPLLDMAGTEGADDITAASAANIDAGAGNDRVTGSDEADVIDGGSGRDTMAGGSGNDVYEVDQSGDQIIEASASGYDRVTASVDYTLAANVEDLRLAGSAIVGIGNASDNRLSGNELANRLEGAAGNDIIAGELGDDTLLGGDGSDTYVYALGDGADRLIDGVAATATDVLVLPDIDAASITVYRPSSRPEDLVLALPDGGQITIEGFVAGRGVARVELAQGVVWSRSDLESKAANAPILATAPPQALADPYLYTAERQGIIDADLLLANDISPTGAPLHIIAVANVANGTVTLRPDGNLDYAGPATGGAVTFSYVVSDGLGGTASTTARIEIAVPGIVLTGTNNGDSLAGGAGADTITGNLGDDTLLGLAGDDLFLVSGLRTGYDIYDGGLGYDAIWGSAGDDEIGLAPGSALVSIESIDAGAGYDALLGSSEADLIDLSAVDLRGIELIDGRAGSDTIIGSAGADTIASGSGNDVLYGAAGDDVFLNNTGTKYYDGGAGFDMILGTPGDDLFRISGAIGNLASIERLDAGQGNDTLRGTSGDDLIDVSRIELLGLEQIDATSGNDTIIASLGNDNLRGGGGSDVFAFGAVGGHDTIMDFHLGTVDAPLADVIDLMAWNIGSYATLMSSHVSDTPDGSTLVTRDGNTDILLVGVHKSQLKADDFRL